MRTCSFNSIALLLPGTVLSPAWEVLSQRLRSAAIRICQGFAFFPLAEVLAALVFMAILIAMTLEGLSIASRAGEVAARKSEAALVGERILNASLIATNWNTTVQTGIVRQGPREFRWTLRNDPWN